jgi:copper(I)-binding protein
MRTLAFIAALLLGTLSLAHAHSFTSGTIQIGHPWAQPTDAGATTASVYLSLMNMGEAADQLTGAQTSIAHKTKLNDGKGEVQTIELPVKRGVPMRPGSARIELQGLKGGLTVGDKFTLRLTFANAAPVDVSVFVEDGVSHN